MNTPTHIICGACLAQDLAARSLDGRPSSLIRRGGVVAGAVLVGLVSHLLLDLLPHYAWPVYLDAFAGFPYHWLIREAVLGLAVAIPAIILARRVWPYVALGMLGAIYPDVEKVLSVDFHVSSRFILFEWHSTYLSSRTAGLPKGILIVFEILLIAGFLSAMWRNDATRDTPSVQGGGMTGCS